MKVLVTYGKHPKTLSVVRSLGRSGRRVIVADDTRLPICAFSKYCDERVVVPSPSKEPGLFASEIRRISSSGLDYILPMDDPECDIFAGPNCPSDLGAQVIMTSRQSYQIARDKNQTMQLAKRLGVPTPMTVPVSRDSDLRDLVDEIGLPILIKPTMSSGSRGVRIIKESDDGIDIPGLVDTYGPCLAQEYVPSGGGVGVSLLLNKGEVRASFVHNRILEFPREGGASIVRVSATNPAAQESAESMATELGWHGVCMVEFRVHAQTGVPMLMEVNPRFWGSLPLAMSSGVDFPRLLMDMYEHGDVPVVRDYTKGVRSMNFLPRGIASMVAYRDISWTKTIFRELLASDTLDIEDPGDPWPAIGAILYMARAPLNRGLYRSVLDRQRVQ